jgi:hypothetical protein
VSCCRSFSFLNHTTSLERSRLAELRAPVDLTGRPLLLVLRLLVGSIGETAGLALLAASPSARCSGPSGA